MDALALTAEVASFTPHHTMGEKHLHEKKKHQTQICSSSYSTAESGNTGYSGNYYRNFSSYDPCSQLWFISHTGPYLNVIMLNSVFELYLCHVLLA